MATCSYCDSFILFGGKTDETGRYCSEKCQQAGHLLVFASQLPGEQMDQLVEKFHQGACPRCGGTGPVDVHKAHQVWSALFMTSWSSKPVLSCKSCATKRQLGGIVFSGVLGWWGLPWGLVMTPLQIVRNIGEMIGGPKAGTPSALLQKYVRLQAGAVLAGKATTQPARPEPAPLPSQEVGDERYMPRA
jgi:hypothetical protein